MNVAKKNRGKMIKTLQQQGLKGLNSCDILRHVFCIVLINNSLQGTFCDMFCRKFATNRVAKLGLYLIDLHLFTKYLSQLVATKKGFNYMNSS